jgi:hypothetical protein
VSPNNIGFVVFASTASKPGNMAHKDNLKASLEATKVEYKRLGSCGLKVSVPILFVVALPE